jgi:uncharacterized membrane protein YbhN (UPF0104 family)
MTAQIVYIATGLAAAAMLLDRNAANGAVLDAVTLGLLLALAGAAGFFLAQKRGFALAERLAKRFLPRAAVQAAESQRWMDRLHSSPRLLRSFAIHLCAWFVSAGGAWFIVYLMGVRVSFASMVAIESLLCGIRSAAVLVPAGLGVQEAAYAFLGPLFGVPMEVAIAISLLKRGRDIAIGIPILLGYQALESGRFFAKPRPLPPENGS